MPAIQVYKTKGKIIPVNEAKVARAYQCPFTKELFVTKTAYTKHLSKLRETRMWANARRKQHQLKLQDLWNQTSFDKIAQWIELNPDVFWYNGRQSNRNSPERWDKIRDQFQIKIVRLSLSWSDSVSNSHSSPRNGVTNWSGRSTLQDGSPAPRGYPGWQGRIYFQTSCDTPGFFSDFLRGTRIHTGTGGSGQYDVKFFEDDWPGLSKARVWNTLKNITPAPVHIQKKAMKL